jgi:hypothetical protein
VVKAAARHRAAREASYLRGRADDDTLSEADASKRIDELQAITGRGSAAAKRVAGVVLR